MKNLATYWLTMDIHKYSQEFHFLMKNNRTKSRNNRKPYYYKDIIYYIKNYNKNILKIETTTKNIYQEIIKEGSKQHTIAGETQWKKYLPTIDFQHIWKKHIVHMRNHSVMTCTTDYYITLLKQMTTCTNYQMTLNLTVTTANSYKTTYTSLQNAQKYKESERTTNQC